MAKNAPNLALAFGLPPERAVEYFRSRGMRIAGDWRSVATAVRSGSFSVAGVMKAQVLDDIRAALQEALDSGKTYEEFKKDLVSKLQSAGWWGRWPTDPETGEILPGKGVGPRRLETIFRTNLQGAYMAGRYKGMIEASDSHPYWMYVAVMDGRTRPAHQLLNGRIFRWDDPVWEVIYPPNGYNCRCRVRPLTRGDMARKGLVLSESAGNIDSVEVDLGKRGGKIPVRGLRDPSTGQRFAPDPGFDHNPSAAWSLDVELARRVATIRSAEIRSQTWQALNNSPERKAAWMEVVDSVLASRGETVRKAGHDGFVLGFVDDEIAGFARRMAPDKEPVRVVVMSQQGILHADSLKHRIEGIALTRDQYAMLPNMAANPAEVYWDVDHESLAYIERLADDTVIYLGVTPGWRLKKLGAVDASKNAMRILAGELKNRNRFVPMGVGR